MAVFMDTGGGDYYGAETKEACLKAIRLESGGDYELSGSFEVSGDTPVMAENEDGTNGPMSTLEAEYTNLGYGYCIASTNT